MRIYVAPKRASGMGILEKMKEKEKEKRKEKKKEKEKDPVPSRQNGMASEVPLCFKNW